MSRSGTGQVQVRVQMADEGKWKQVSGTGGKGLLVEVKNGSERVVEVWMEEGLRQTGCRYRVEVKK